MGFIVHAFGKLIAFGSGGGITFISLAITSQKTPSQRAPGNDAHALITAKRQHFSLLFTINSIHVVLHGRKTGPTVQIGRVLGLGKLPGIHAGSANIERLARFHYIVQRFHCFFDRGLVIPAVNLVEINVIGAQTTQRIINPFHDMLA